MLLVRVANKADLPAILQVYAQTEADDGKVLTLQAAESLFGRMQKYPDYSLYVAVLNGQVVGSFALPIMDNLAHLGATSGVVEDVVVAPKYQRRV